MTRQTATALITFLATAPMTAPALAQDIVVYGGAALEFLNRPDGPDEPNRSSFEAYVEADLAGFYAGTWVRKSDNSDYDRVDLYLGYRNDLDSGFFYDLGYYHYGYPADSAWNYGELYAGVGQVFGEIASVTLDLAYDPDSEVGNVYVGIEYYVGEKWTLSTNYGSYQVLDAASEQEWDIGATYNLSDTAGVDLRWYDGSEYVDDYIGLFLSFDTTLLDG